MWIISEITDLKNQDKTMKRTFFNLSHRQEVPKPPKKKPTYVDAGFFDVFGIM